MILEIRAFPFCHPFATTRRLRLLPFGCAGDHHAATLIVEPVADTRGVSLRYIEART